MAQTFVQILSNARLLAAGIRKNEALLSKRGITEERAQEIEALAKEVETLDSEQESLKARLKNTTEKLSLKTKDLKEMMATDVRIVKADIPQSLWKEFGIQAKK
jgi:seryl-tRNA synthetase